MIITKGDKIFTITEFNNHWNAKRKVGGIDVAFQISKELCPTFEALEEYIMKESLF